MSTTVPSHLLKLAIECLLVMFERSFDMDCGPLVSALVRVQLDDHSLGVDMREMIVLQIQQLLLLVIQRYQFDKAEVKAYFQEYLM